ncbi:uncharacterized protein LOC132756807 [Ruditapes philippinarum]|uniref:uncharacterized protein LOC132756807 n=1 Tax=Ruditapes philippinarum TaxID=129788 RepID=UPI00295AD7AF|nr:uncharacterized protein LOC132756807 [Ruditapes philippinarum]
MTDLKSCLILILLTKFVETKISPDVRCAVNGDVYLRKSSQRSNLTSRSSEYIFASSETTVCDHQVAGDVLKIHGCVQPGVSSRVDVFLHGGSDSSLHIYRINCLPLVSTRHHETYQAADLSGKDREYLTYQEPIVGQRRRKDVSGDVNAGNDDDDGIKNLQTSVSFEVKLNFSSNDEISIACNPDNLGILYVSNPDPDQLIYVVSFSELTKQKMQF